jgi:hypothetical protein
MAFSHVYGAYNAEGSVNEWFQTNLTAWGVPSWMPSARVLFDVPRDALHSGYSGHAFSVIHLGEPEVLETYQGRHTIGGSAGQRVGNLMRVDCWGSRAVMGESYPMKMRQMADMVTYLFSSGREVVIKNLYTGAQAPSGIGALVRLSPAEGVSVAPDPNPDVVRRSFLARYWWIERV